MKSIFLALAIMINLQTSALAFTVTSPFGWRVHPISGEQKFHTGIDIAADEGTPIPVLWDGQVVYADWYDGYGYAVITAHGNDTYTLYGHCSELLTVPGDMVSQGQIIAYSGSTGNVTGPHIHLELISKGEYIDPMLIWREGK